MVRLHDFHQHYLQILSIKKLTWLTLTTCKCITSSLTGVADSNQSTESHDMPGCQSVLGLRSSIGSQEPSGTGHFVPLLFCEVHPGWVWVRPGVLDVPLGCEVLKRSRAVLSGEVLMELLLERVQTVAIAWTGSELWNVKAWCVGHVDHEGIW